MSCSRTPFIIKTFTFIFSNDMESHTILIKCLNRKAFHCQCEIIYSNSTKSEYSFSPNVMLLPYLHKSVLNN